MSGRTPQGPISFTYYGDLLGISNLYTGNPAKAYEALNQYDNEVYLGLEPYFQGHQSRQVEMFSDSLIVTGDDPVEFLSTMAPVYCNLLAKGLFLRGGIVEGLLEKDLRMTTSNFRKNLPTTDVLARAVRLEHKVKGARLVVEQKLALQLIQPQENWMTLVDYARDPKSGERDLLFQRAIVPLDDGSASEVLYPLLAELDDETVSRRVKELAYLKVATAPEIAKHYEETDRLLKHSRMRLAHHRGI